jgi:hypothetical protein
MDAETKEYLDGWFAEILAAMNAGFSRLERRSETPERHADLGELEDRVLSLEDRFRTMQLRMEQLEWRVENRLDVRSVR